MKIPKSPFKRSLKLAALSAGLWKEEVARLVGLKKVTASRLKQASLLVEELGNLKGAAMKLGQTLALESRDFLPEEVVVILEKLQNQTSFLPFLEVDTILESELKERRRLIENLSFTPIAAASIGQVHRARYRDRLIALKVQYPGIKESVESDLRVLERILTLSSPLVGKGKTDFSFLFEELREVFRKETSYQEEARATQRYRELAKALVGVRVPEVFLEVSSDRVLALSFEGGKTLSESLRSGYLDEGRKERLASLLLSVFVSEFHEWGLVQTDPNPANFLIDEVTGELVLLDFGATREYSPHFRQLYSQLVQANLSADRVRCLELAEEMQLLDPREKREAKDAFFNLMTKGMEPFRKERFDFGMEKYPEQMRQLGRELIQSLEFTAPPRSILFLHRKLGGLFQIVRRMKVQLDLRPFLERLRP